MDHEFYYYHVVDEKSGTHAFYRTYEEHESGEMGTTVEDLLKEAEEKESEGSEDEE